MRNTDMNEIIKELSPEYLVFRLESEFFTLEAADVLEVMKFAPVTEIPRVPPWLPGIINMRGNLISVIDLAMIFGMDADIVKAWFVICEAGPLNARLNIAMPVTAVEDVIRIHPDQITPPPEIGISINTDFIRGVVKYEDDLLLLMLDMDRIIRHAEDEIVKITGKNGI